MTIKTELLDIQATSNDDMLHCQHVVDWARGNPNSALHQALEWNNKKAADAHRIWQVRQLITLYIGVENRESAMISLSVDRRGGGGYRRLSDVINTPNLRDIMLKDALDELTRMQARYATLSALASVWAEAAQIREATGNRRKRPAVANAGIAA